MTGIPDPAKNIFETYSFVKSNLLRNVIQDISNVRNHTQANFDNLHAGGVRVAFVSLTPAEKAFFQLGKNTALGQAYKLITKLGVISREKIIKSITGYEAENINYLDTIQKDYYTEAFLDEYTWLIGFARNNGDYPVAFPKNYEALEQNLNNSPNTLNIILNVEGAHVFGPTPSDENLANLSKTYDLTTDQMDDMIANIKDIKKQPIPIFSVGIFHHFWNGLGGHAVSLSGIVDKITNQTAGVNTGLNENGKRIVRELIRAEGNSKGIIVDIKHMSLKCRRDYYAMRDNENAVGQSPIFCSHTGINSRWKTINSWIGHQSESIAGEKYLHENPINLCAEDVERIFDSGGLIGLQLDEKRLLGKDAIKEINAEREDDNMEGNDDYVSYTYAKYFWANIFFAIDSLAKSKGAIQASYWNIFSIGSDFDGIINHLKNCKDASRLESFKTSCFAFLVHPEDIPIHKIPGSPRFELSIARLNTLKGALTNSQIVDKIFGENAKEFLRRNF